MKHFWLAPILFAGCMGNWEPEHERIPAPHPGQGCRAECPHYHAGAWWYALSNHVHTADGTCGHEMNGAPPLWRPTGESRHHKIWINAPTHPGGHCSPECDHYIAKDGYWYQEPGHKHIDRNCGHFWGHGRWNEQ